MGRHKLPIIFLVYFDDDDDDDYVGEIIILKKNGHKVNTVKVLLCKSHGWIFTHWVRGVKVPLQKYGWIFIHDILKESFIVTYGEG